MIALAIIALAYGLALPAGIRSVSSAERSAARLTLDRWLLEARRDTIDAGLPVRLPEGLVTLGGGFTMRSAAPIEFFPDGRCSGGDVTILKDDKEVSRFQIASEICKALA